MDKVEQLKEWNKAYRAGTPLVPDVVYDVLLEELPEDHPYRQQVEPEVLYKNRIKHSKPMLSMQKTKTEEGMSKWINNILKVAPSDTIIRCSAKLDGIAGKCDDYKLITRGDGIYGNDITNAFDKGIVTSFRNEPIINLKYPILGEFVVKLDYFNENLSKDFSHPRNFVSGAIMSDTVNTNTNKAFEDEAIVFQSYSLLPNIVTPIIELLNNFRETEEAISNSVNYAIDGVIFEVVNPNIKEILRETDHHPNWAIALKPKDKIYTSTIINIIWQTGRTGKLTPVIIIEPVDIDGVIVQRASGHNAKTILEMGIKIGVTVELIRSGSVIPYIVKVVGDKNGKDN